VPRGARTFGAACIVELSERGNESEAGVAAQLARAARRRWGLPRGGPLAMAYVLPAAALNLGLLFGSFWLAFGPMIGYFPKPYGWIVAVQVGSAWLAVVMVWCFPKRYSIFHGLGGRRPDLLYDAGERRIHLVGIWFPTVFVFLLYYDFCTTVHPAALILPACLVGGVLFVAAVLRDRELWSDRNRLDLALAILLSFSYGYATVLQLNCALDSSPVAVYQSLVIEKRVSRDPYRFRRGPHLRIEPWGPEHESRMVSVPYTLYDATQPRDRVCMVLRKGALGATWYTAQPCPYNGAPVVLEPGGSL